MLFLHVAWFFFIRNSIDHHWGIRVSRVVCELADIFNELIKRKNVQLINDGTAMDCFSSTYLAKTSSNMLWFCVCVKLCLQTLKMKLNFDWRRVGSVGRFSWPFMDFWTTSHGLFFWTHYCVCNQSKMCAKSLAVTHFVGLLLFDVDHIRRSRYVIV